MKQFPRGCSSMCSLMAGLATIPSTCTLHCSQIQAWLLPRAWTGGGHLFHWNPSHYFNGFWRESKQSSSWIFAEFWGQNQGALLFLARFLLCQWRWEEGKQRSVQQDTQQRSWWANPPLKTKPAARPSRTPQEVDFQRKSVVYMWMEERSNPFRDLKINGKDFLFLIRGGWFI